MTESRPSRRDLMKPVQLLGFAFAAAVFGGLVALVSMGFFTGLTDAQRGHVVVVSLVVAGISFIATLVIIALLILAVDPAQLEKPVDRAVLLPDEDDTPDAGDVPGAAAGSDGSDGDGQPQA